MPSTYTVNLGIEKPATGEQSGTWGDTTNVNFDILDQAINGAARVTLTSAGSSGSPNALQITNGATSDGRNKWVEFYSSSDLGGSVYVQLDPNDAEKIVFVRNSLAGSRSILLFQGTYNSGRDLEVPAGVDMVVKFDGGGASAATVTDVFTKLRATEITTPTLTATTADINGGTIDNSVIGGSTAAAVTGTAVVANTSLNIAGDGATVTGIKDEDNMASNSATKLATQQSIKAYVDSQVGTVDTWAEVLANGATSGSTNPEVTAGQALKTNTINETSAGSGVTIDSVLLKDDVVNATDVETGSISANDGTAAATIADTTGNFTITNFISNSVDIGGGAIDGTTIGGSSAATGTFSQVNVDNITIDGNEIDVSSGDLTLDVAGDIELNADGSTIVLKDNTLARFTFNLDSTPSLQVGGTSLEIETTTDNASILFKGSDGGSAITALTLDMSDEGAATFNSAIALKNTLSISSASTSGFLQASSNILQFGTSSNDPVDFYANNTLHMSLKSDGEFIVNETGSAEGDFRVESDSNANMLFVDAGNNRVGIANSSPEYPLDVTGVIQSGDQITVSGSKNFALNYSNGTIATIGGYYGSGGLVLGYGVWPKSGASSFVSSSAVELSRQAIHLNGYNFDMYSATNQTVAADADVTLALHARLSGIGGYVFNEASADIDFRVESNGNANMLFVDGGNDHVNIGTSSDFGGVLNVNGGAVFDDSTTLDPDTMGTGRLGIGQISDGGGFAAPGFCIAGTGGDTAAVVGAGGNMYLGTGDGTSANSLKTRLLLNAGEAVFNDESLDTDFRVESDSNANMLFVDAGNNVVVIGGTTAETADTFEVISSDTNTNVRIRNTNAGDAGPRLIFDKSSASAANDDNVGELLFIGKDSGGNAEQYARLLAESSNVTSGAEDGTVSLEMMVNGTNTQIYNHSHVGTVYNEEGKASQDFRVESDSNTHALFVDASINRVGILNNNPAYAFHVDAEIASSGYYRVDSSSTYDGTSLLTLKRNGNTTGDYIQMRDGSNNVFATFDEGGIIFNEIGGDTDFRVESAVNAQAVFVNGANSRVGLGTIGPESQLHLRETADTANKMVIDHVSAGNSWGGYIESIGGANQGLVIGRKFNASYTPVISMNVSGQSTFAGNLVIPNQIIHEGDTSNYMQFHQADGWRVVNSGGERFHIQGNQAVFNHDGHDADFRVESDTNANMLFVDGGNDRVSVGGTGVNQTGSKFYVDGRSTFNNGSVTGGAVIITDAYNSSTDDHLFNIGTQRSSGGPFMSYGLGQNGSDADWIATYDNFSGSHSVMVLNGSTFEFKCDASNSQTTLGDAVTLLDVFKLGRSGVIANGLGDATLDFRVESDTNNYALFVDAGAGSVNFGTSSTNPANGIRFTALDDESKIEINHASGTGSGVAYATFRYNLSAVGSITQHGTSATLYNTTSDERLKENIVDADDAGSKVDSIKVRQYDWKADGSHQDYGMVAQELQAVAPEAVSAPEDPDKMMGVDYSKLVPMLIKEIQSLRARVADLES